MTRLILSASLFAAGCVATPVPEPPNFAAPSLDRVDFPGGTSGISVEGQRGAVAPEVNVWIVNIDGAEAPTLTPSAADGSFSAFVGGGPGDELRMQVRLGERTSLPVDVRPPDMVAVAHPLDGCLGVDLELDLGDVATGAQGDADLVLRNDCAASVNVASVDVRVAGSPFSVVTAAPLVVPVGGEAAITFRVAPTAIGAQEEIARITIDAPEVERRAVTLFARGRAP